MKYTLFAILLLSVIVLTACGGPAPATPPASAAPVTITVSTDSSPAMMGDMTLIFTVVDSSGQPVTGADLDVIADHTDKRVMTMHGKATEQGNGIYAITANFSMAGK